MQLAVHVFLTNQVSLVCKIHWHMNQTICGGVRQNCPPPTPAICCFVCTLSRIQESSDRDNALLGASVRSCLLAISKTFLFQRKPWFLDIIFIVAVTFLGKGHLCCF